MNTAPIPFEQLPTEVALMRQELRELKELLKIKVAPLNKGEYLEIAGASAFLGISKQALRQRVARGGVPHFRRETRLCFKRSELIEYLESGRVESDETIAQNAEDILK